jgi:hypothetical protein
MTFLAKLGAAILKFTEIVAGISPVLATALPGQSGTITTVSNDLAQIANIIGIAESMGQAISAPGAQKLTMAAPQVAQIILQSSILVNHSIEDPALFQKAVTEIAGGVADLLNSLKANVDTTSKT